MGRPNKPRYREDQDAWVTKIGGVQHTLAKGKKNKKAAERKLAELLLADRQALAAPGMTLQVVLDLFLRAKEKTAKPLTMEWYQRHLADFAKSVGKQTPAEDVRPYHVTDWLDAREWGPTTRHGAITAVKAAFRWARRQGRIAADPIADLEKPTPKTRQTDLTADKAAVIRYAVKDRAFADFLAVLRETGMRPSEAMALEASMIDFEGGVIDTKGKGRDRAIYLTEAAATLLRELAARHPEGPLLRNMRGRPWTRNATACRFARLRARGELGLGAEATAESYRHAFVTDGLESGVPIATMAELVGHKSTKMIERHYSRLRARKKHLADAVKKVRPSGSGEDPGPT